MGIFLIVTEHRGFLDEARLRAYERVRRRLETVAATTVSRSHYAEVEDIQDCDAVVLSGSSAPWATHDERMLERLGEAVRAFDGPVLGICAGMQLQAMFAGGSVSRAQREAATGFAPVEVVDEGDLLRGLAPQITVYHRHTDEVTSVPKGFRVVARSAQCEVEAIVDPARRWWGTQFHPEEFSPSHPDGERVLRNFFELARVR
ncbi:MAG: gamma-glutamyl-gamma-aminobutyrate hydrolase family protein [Actinobacteria bacterium]|nr:gamma-glutamyl-gamma-aminobutyrate hydrolase family protein [Actinomycetota bacterium]